MRLPALCMTALLTLVLPLAAAEWVHPFDVEQGAAFPEEAVAVVEIPARSFVKYEIDKETGHVKVDRFVSMSVAYPANYGTFPQTLSDDGDALDVLVLTRTPLHPGVFIEVRPIGYLKMLDGGEADDKVLAVPTTRSDPTWEEVREISDLPAVERERIEAFFRVYKQLPEGGKKIKLKGWAAAAEARWLLRETHQRYRAERSRE